MEKNRNYYIAIVFSVLIVFIWQFFYMGPKMEAERQREAAQQAELAKTKKAEQPAADIAAAPVPGTDGAAVAVINRDQALAEVPRVTIDTPALTGSINLIGARLDDLKLKNYRETIDKTSPIITLFSPGNTKDGYFVELGFTGAAGTVPNSKTQWTVEGNSKLTADTPVTLVFTNEAGSVFTRKIAVDKDYMFTIEDSVKNGSAQPLSLAPYGRVVRYNQPAHASAWVLHEGYIGVMDGSLKEETFAKATEEPFKFEATTAGWLGITDKYWAAAIVPQSGAAFTSNFSHVTKGQPLFQADYRTNAADTIAAGETKTFKTMVFAGAKQVPLVEAYAEKNGIESFDKLIDWGWFYFFTKPMFYLMDWLFRYFGNFGLAILGTTVIVKLLFFPIANRQYASMAKMKTLQPKMEELKAKFGDDRMGLQTAMMQLYKEEKVNPLAGCWPILLQIPVFFALYKVIYVTIEMRHAPFFGWIQDLSAPDPTTLFNLFGLIPWDPPQALMLGVWPIIMGITMFVQMRMNPTPPDPTQAMIFNWMPLIFTFMLGSFPAGLVIYWAWNNTLSVLQQGIIMKRHGVKIELFDNLKNLFKRKPSSA
ncbi:MAG: inner membrane protein oxaA [Pseudomonadota bacterium]